jgi:hypothetical protein
MPEGVTYRLAKNVKSEKSGAWPLVNLYRFPISRTFPSDATRIVFAVWTLPAGGANRLAAAAYFALSHECIRPRYLLIIVLIECYGVRDINFAVGSNGFAVILASMRESGAVTGLDGITLRFPD